MIRTFLVAFFMCVAIALPAQALAHQPRVVEGTEPIVVTKPEISKAYYGKLSGTPQVFIIEEKEPFTFYMNVLVPDTKGIATDVSAVVTDMSYPKIPLARAGGKDSPWRPYFETFGGDKYLRGSEFRSVLPAGRYEIVVSSIKNDSLYSFVVGEGEYFGPREILNTFIALPKIKVFFFGKPAYTAFLSPVLGLPLLVFILLLLGGGYWFLRRRRTRRA